MACLREPRRRRGPNWQGAADGDQKAGEAFATFRAALSRPEIGPDFFPDELAVAVLVQRLDGGRGVGDFGCGDNGIVVGVPAPGAKAAVYSSLFPVSDLVVMDYASVVQND